jgi:hypothetical protein
MNDYGLKTLFSSIFVFSLLPVDARAAAPESSRVYVVRSGEEIAVAPNTLGYNPRNYMVEEPYSQPHDPALQPALVQSQANCIRYPGGTFANYWDYANDRMFPPVWTKNPGGWVDPEKIDDDPTENIRKRIENGIGSGKGIVVNSVDDLKYAAKGGTSGHAVNVVFHMNMVTPGSDFYASEQGWNRPVNTTVGSRDWYAMLDDRIARFKAMLLRVQAGPDAIPIRFIELGNEYYFPLTYVREAFPEGADYGTACNYVAQKLKADKDLNLPDDVRIAAVACSIPGKERSKWNRSLIKTLDPRKVEDVTMHAYEAYKEPAVFTEEAFQQRLAEWIEMVDQKFERSGADECFIRAAKPWRVWYTETNANWEGGFKGDPSGANEWAESLVDAFSVVYLYARGNASIVLQFQFNNQVKPDAEITDGVRLYNRALALMPFMQAARDATSVAVVNFKGTSMPTLPDSPEPVVQGLVFKTDGGTPRCALINLSGSIQHVDLARHIFPDAPTTVHLQGYKNGLADVETAQAFETTSPASDVSLPPYSVTRIWQ